MPVTSRNNLKNTFSDGNLVTGADFCDIIDSCVNKNDDLVDVDADGNLDIPGGLNLKDTALGSAGTLRFNSGQVQVNDGANWVGVSGGGGGAFEEVDGGPNVAFDGGNVGIGSFAPSPTYRLEVNLGVNTGEEEQVRMGNAVIANGPGASQTAAQFSHRDHALDNRSYAIRQGEDGEVNVNAPSGERIIFTHNRTFPRLLVDPTGVVVIAGTSLLSGVNNQMLQVNGNAFKNTGGSTWATFSDARLKQDIQPFKDGLGELMKVNPVKFRYDGRLATDPDREEVGILGHEIEKVFPYMTSREDVKGEKDLEDGVITFDAGALTYVMVNAIQELAQRVEQLEKQLESKKRRSGRNQASGDS